jgi:signal transduction histidine kinase
MRSRLEQAIAERTAELARSRELVRSLGVHNTRLLEEERKRVARELHDEMGQQLAALRMEISVLRRRAPENGHPPDDAALGMLLARVEDLVASMRSVVAELRPPALDGGLSAALDWLVDAFERHADVPCEVEIDDCARRLTPDAAVMVFRIAQESLNNVRRHAQARHAWLRLAREGKDCEVTIGDDGVGFDPANREPGYGILGMEERAIALGGTLTIASTCANGCIVRLRLPLPATALDACRSRRAS